MTTGKLILVVGPSGAGKDTLINAARDELAGNKNFIFPKRIVTRDAIAELEDHDTIDRTTFDKMRTSGDYTLCWEAHGLGYILPAAIKQALAQGKTAICNVSRAIIGEAKENFPETRVFLVTAAPQIRAKRLANRGRETEAEITARLSREPAPIPAHITATEIDNSTSRADGIKRFIAALEDVATSDKPPQTQY